MSEELLVLGIGVSPYPNDGVLRFEHFCRSHHLNYKIVGKGKEWRGGDMEKSTGGGQKIKELLEEIENMENRLIIVCDTFDLIPVAEPEEILKKYHATCPDNQILFSSEVFCWPDKHLANNYPPVQTKYKYLNSGSFMGYRNDIYDLIKNDPVMDNDDDQRFYTLKYLAGKKIILDHNCHLFQAINGAKNDLVIHKNRIYNKYTNSYPVFLHGNGPSKLFLNHLENYLESELNKNYSETIVSYHLEMQPKIFFALYVDSTYHDRYCQFTQHVFKLDYENKEIYIYDKTSNDAISQITEKMGYHYRPNITTYQFNDFRNTDCQYYFLLEQQCILTKKDILHELVSLCHGYHRILTPMLVHQEKSSFSNFWIAIDSNDYYLRSDDYFDLVKYQKRGLWNVPYVCGALFMERSVVLDFNLLKEKRHGDDNDINLCHNCRRQTLFMYMVNNHHYGYLV